jgi:four helix bundle protein
VNSEEVSFARLCLAFLFDKSIICTKGEVFMKESPLMIKSKEFALDVIKICKELRFAKCESALINQFLRSGTSIGANIREAFYAHGKADFIAKLQIALKECSESEYWIELLLESGYYNDRTILVKCTEIKRILIASINTAKENNK